LVRSGRKARRHRATIQTVASPPRRRELGSNTTVRLDIGDTSKHRQNEASQKNESAVASASLILIRSRVLSPVLHLHSDSVFPTLQLAPDARGEQTRHRPPNPAAGLREQELGREGRVHVRVELRRGRRRPPRHLHRQVLLRQLLQVAGGRRRRTKRRQQTAEQ